VHVDLAAPAPAAMAALRDGRVQAVVTGAHTTLAAFPRWKGAKVVVAVAQGTPWLLVLRADHSAARGDVQAVKGLRLGAARRSHRGPGSPLGPGDGPGGGPRRAPAGDGALGPGHHPRPVPGHPGGDPVPRPRGAGLRGERAAGPRRRPPRARGLPGPRLLRPRRSLHDPHRGDGRRGAAGGLGLRARGPEDRLRGEPGGAVTAGGRAAPSSARQATTPSGRRAPTTTSSSAPPPSTPSAAPPPTAPTCARSGLRSRWRRPAPVRQRTRARIAGASDRIGLASSQARGVPAPRMPVSPASLVEDRCRRGSAPLEKPP